MGADSGLDRETLWSAVHDLIAAVRAGATASFGVVGEPGCGLTTFLRDVAARASAELTVRTAAALDHPQRFGIALPLLGLPAHAVAVSSGGRGSFFEAGVSGAADAMAVETLLRRTEVVVGDSPQLWVVDDAHLAGAGALRWLDDLIRAATLPVGVLYGTHDPGLTLGPTPRTVTLTASAAATRAHRSPAQLVDQIREAVGDSLVPAAAAVIGQRFHVADVADIVGQPLAACVADIVAMERAGLIEPDGDAYRFTRRQLREAAGDARPKPVRAALHAAYARLLMARDDDPLTVAEHLMAAGGRVDGDVEWLTAAAESIVRADAPAAVALLDRAASLVHDHSRRLSTVRARALSTVGRVSEAEALARLLLADAVGDERAALLRDLAMAYFHQGRAGDTVATMLHAADEAVDPRLRTRLRAECATAHLLAADFATARAVAAEGSRLGEQIGDPVTVLAAEMVGCLVAFYQYDIPEALRLAERLEMLADLPEASEAALYQPWFAASLIRHEVDQHDHSRRLNAIGRQRALATGHLWMAPAYDALDAYSMWETGEFDDAVAAASGALAWRLDDTFGAEIWCHAFLGRIAAARGQWAEAARRAEQARALVLPGQAQFGWDHLALLDADLAVHQERPAEAYKTLRENWEVFLAFGIASPRQDIAVALVPLVAEYGDGDFREAILADLAESSARTRLPAWRTDLAYAEAWRAADWAALERCADRYAAIGRRHRAARVLVEAARMAERTDRAAARRIARRAQGVLEPLEADADLDPIRHLCSHRRRRTGAGTLTKSETAVVELVAAGLTNTEIAERLVVSRRTVESHVSSAYRKLNVGTRVELARRFLALS